MRRSAGPILLLALLLATGPATPAATPATRDGAEVMARFHARLAAPGCGDASPRWKRHYAHAAQDLAGRDAQALMLFGYVLDALLAADLPAEFALIPFVESRYRPDVRSPGGQVGLWQFTAATARRHGIRIRGGIDERRSIPIATRAAVRHLQRLQRTLGGDWRTIAIAYNAGEGALRASRRTGGKPLNGIARSYPAKLHAIACLLADRGAQARWQAAVARQVPRLVGRELPAGTRDLHAWARAQGHDPTLVAALNPGWRSGMREVLAPVSAAGAGPDPAGEAN